jgi:hypothetical protein
LLIRPSILPSHVAQFTIVIRASGRQIGRIGEMARNIFSNQT